jgi:hypothetical protein
MWSFKLRRKFQMQLAARILGELNKIKYVGATTVTEEEDSGCTSTYERD